MVIPKPDHKQIYLNIFEETIFIKFSGAMKIVGVPEFGRSFEAHDWTPYTAGPYSFGVEYLANQALCMPREQTSF